jgi:hypothetical protein
MARKKLIKVNGLNVEFPPWFELSRGKITVENRFAELPITAPAKSGSFFEG